MSESLKYGWHLTRVMRHALISLFALLLLGGMVFVPSVQASHVEVVLRDTQVNAGTVRAVGETLLWTPVWGGGTNRLIVLQTFTRTVTVTSATLNGAAMSRWSVVTGTLGAQSVRFVLWVFMQTLPDGELSIFYQGSSDDDLAAGQVSASAYTGVNAGRPLEQVTTDIQTSTPATYPNCFAGIANGVCRDAMLTTIGGYGTLWTALLEGNTVDRLGGNDADATLLNSFAFGALWGSATYFEDSDTDENLFTWRHGDGSGPNSGLDSLYVNTAIIPAGHEPVGGGDDDDAGGGGFARSMTPKELTYRCPSLSSLDWLVAQPVTGSLDVTVYDNRRDASFAIQYLVNWGDGTATAATSAPISHTYEKGDLYLVTARIAYQNGAVAIYTTYVDTRANNCALKTFAEDIVPPILLLAGLALITAFILIVTRRSTEIIRMGKTMRKRVGNVLLWAVIILVLFVVGVYIYAQLAGIPT